MDYYTSIILLTWIGLATLGILVMENNRLARDDKRLMYLTYALIALSALAEWGGVQLDGREDLPVVLLRVVKCADYILTPMAGGAIIMQIHLNNRWQKATYGILAANTVLQVVTAFTGWMLVIDEQHRYHHGSLFPVYMGVCIFIILLIIIQFILYGKSYREENRKSLYTVMLLIVSGILIQELTDNRTAYIGMTLGAAMMFIHYSEFSQMTADDFIQKQQTALDTDSLTGLLSRYAYDKVVQEYGQESLPEGLAVFVIDVNGLKKTNDTLGHEAGDEMIRGVADCISRTFGDTGRCFRTGGDEYVVMLPGADTARAEALQQKLQAEIGAWHGEKVQRLNISAGYALSTDAPDSTIGELISTADGIMYKAKDEYYRTSGEDRRRAR